MKDFVIVSYSLKHLTKFCATDVDDVPILYHSQDNSTLEVIYNLWVYLNADSGKCNAEKAK
jgi:hypothetical protein